MLACVCQLTQKQTVLVRRTHSHTHTHTPTLNIAFSHNYRYMSALLCRLLMIVKYLARNQHKANTDILCQNCLIYNFCYFCPLSFFSLSVKVEFLPGVKKKNPLKQYNHVTLQHTTENWTNPVKQLRTGQSCFVNVSRIFKSNQSLSKILLWTVEVAKHVMKSRFGHQKKDQCHMTYY